MTRPNPAFGVGALQFVLARLDDARSTWSTPAAGGVKLQYAEFDWALNRK